MYKSLFYDKYAKTHDFDNVITQKINIDDLEDTNSISQASQSSQSLSEKADADFATDQKLGTQTGKAVRQIQSMGPSGHQIIPFIREEDEFEYDVNKKSQTSNQKIDQTADDEQVM